MPQLRKDPVVGRWVIIASERARRPGNFVDTSDAPPEDHWQECPFCDQQEKVIYTGKREASQEADPSIGDVFVVPSNMVGFEPQDGFNRSKRGLYDVINGLGVHEIIVETPEHFTNMADLDVSQIRMVIETYAARMKELEKDMRFQFVLAYKNYGSTAGGRKIAHTHSHVVATPVRPLIVKEKLIGAKKHFDAHQTCIYCDLIKQELETRSRVIHETEKFIAITPFAARFLFEVWILPKDHHCDFQVGIGGDEADLAVMMKVMLQKLQLGLDDPAYNFVIQTAPFRRSTPDAKKWDTIEEDYHWHIELMPRLTRFAGFEKGTDFYICAIPPEDMAEYLRGVKVES